ncbi:arsenic resistance N-acetyltransferase ArsN2 [Caulobacter sp. ErkDOM-YI]|uniref:arsenic resistance N-acetyltransferase ArsN2 n=1 Tax=unclassified Caulobacter TaxID=2648921 RepID=UPI003AF99DD0
MDERDAGRPLSAGKAGGASDPNRTLAGVDAPIYSADPAILPYNLFPDDIQMALAEITARAAQREAPNSKGEPGMAVDARAVPATDRDLLKRLAAAHLPTSDLGEPGQLFFAFENAARAIGCGGLLIAGEHALLRSIAVDADLRGTGVGGQILKCLSDQAQSHGALKAWLLTTDAATFFARHGFEKVDRANAPAVISATLQFAGICPGSATLMMRDLTVEAGLAPSAA